MILRLSIVLLFSVKVRGYETSTDTFLNKILNGYDPFTHPRMSQRDPFRTYFNLFIHHLSVSPGSKVKVNGFVKTEWRDNRLRWNPAEYNRTKMVVLPDETNIWTPILLHVRGSRYETSKDDGMRTKRRLRVVSINRIEVATAVESYQISEEMDCAVLSSFPFETLDCYLDFINANPYITESLRTHQRNIFLKTIFMSDDDSVKLNGWSILSARQIVSVFDPIAGEFLSPSKYLNADPRDLFKKHGAVRCRLIIRRDDPSQTMITLIPIIMTMSILAGAWLTPPKMTLAISIMTVYRIEMFLEDIAQRAPSYAVQIDSNFGIILIFLWVTAVWTCLSHQLYLSFPELFRPLIHFCSRLFRLCPVFVKVESRMLNGKHGTDFSFVFLRTIISFSLLCVSFSLLFISAS